MKRRILIATAAGLSIIASNCLVSAQEIVFTGEKIPLTVINDLNEAAAEKTAEENTEGNTEEITEETTSAGKTVKMNRLNALGVVDDQYVAITYRNGKKGFVPIEEFQEKIPALDLSSLESVNAWTDLNVGSNGDAVRNLQKALVDLSVLDGTVDGAYGPGTSAAVSAYQTSAHLDATGTVDLFTYLSVIDAAADRETLETTYPFVYTAENKFGAFYDAVENKEALEDYLDSSWKVNYDVYAGTGEISNENVIAEYADESRAIDRISIKLNESACILRENDTVSLTPAIKVVSSGAYRPYVQSILLRNDNKVIELEKIESSSEVDGMNVVETSFVELTDEAKKLLAEEGTEIRVEGTNKTFDVR